jgi:hypothetical protein
MAWVATSMKLQFSTFETNGTDRDALKLHSTVSNEDVVIKKILQH